ncbi:alpha-L-rhamnosidase C-terminal domain-containing protein, partial [Candidatus Sumerlaeota bacterium]
GFQRFLIKPELVGDLTWVKGSHDSPDGRIESEWKREDKDFSLKITIPVNSVADVFIPASDASAVSESGNPATKATGVKFLRME